MESLHFSPHHLLEWEGQEAGDVCALYAVLYSQSLEQSLVYSRAPNDWIQFTATTFSCHWGQDGDKARLLQVYLPET